MADVDGLVVVSAGALVTVLQVDRWVAAKEAHRVKSDWRAATGRDCVLLAGGLRVAGFVEDAGTPIFDKMVDSRRWRGLESINRLAFGR